MSSRRNSLSPPAKIHVEDPGAHDLDSDDDHFSDAQSAPGESPRSSPIPTTRVEKISDEPSYGEVPGTEAYRLREGDAAPDEIAIVPEGGEAKKADVEAVADTEVEEVVVPASPLRIIVPTTVLEESIDGEGAKTPDGKKHQTDPMPDLVVKADGTLAVGPAISDEPISPQALLSSPISTRSRRRPSSSSTRRPSTVGSRSRATSNAGGDAEADDFGDDFDDFEEGGNGGDDDDFGDFDDGFEAPSAPAQDLQTAGAAGAAGAAAVPAPQAPQAPPQPSLPFPVPDFADLHQEEVVRAVSPYLNGLYLADDDDENSAAQLPPLSNSVFLTPRSASLWAQLVAPPPLQPPDWIRSRIRRLFLISLGVPVDLDEILPASKQKKLVLPSLTLQSPRSSSDGRGGSNGNGGNSISRLKQSGHNASNSSVDSQGRPVASSRSKRKGPPPVPDLDLVAARQLCMTTDEALDGMTDEELREHLRKLQGLEGTAKEVLEYWTKRTDEKIGDREAFEGVIENLVAHARKTRK